MSDEERLDRLEQEISSITRELSVLRETQNVDRDVLDANVVSIYNRTVEKRSITILCFLSIVSCVLLGASQIIIKIITIIRPLF